jgi:hypothetical protein
MESIPLVTFGQIIGLISILSEGPQTATRCLTITRRSFESMIAWGRYAGIMDYNPNSKNRVCPARRGNATK